jgi:hypothetical protein
MDVDPFSQANDEPINQPKIQQTESKSKGKKCVRPVFDIGAIVPKNTQPSTAANGTAQIIDPS